MTRAHVHVPLSDTTVTRSPATPMRRTGASSVTTPGPRASAILSHRTWVPPTTRSCWAPPPVSMAIWNDPAECA